MSNKKSFIVKIEESILKSMKLNFMDSEDNVNDFLKRRLNAQEKAPKSIFKSISLNGTHAFVFGNENAKNMIMYIHGGAFVNEINYQHYLFCFLLSKKLDAYVIAPIYPLAPKHTFEETFEIITDLYESLIEKNRFNNAFDSDNELMNKRITFMGDSAGGGFVLSFCQHLKTIDLPQPDNIIVFSPWVDISMSNPPYDNESDPILGEIGLRVFVGDNEIFYKDVLKYYENLKEDNVDARLVVGSGMFHIYPLFPCPEAWDAFKELKKEFE